MSQNSSISRKIIAFIAVILLIITAIVFVAFFANSNSPLNPKPSSTASPSTSLTPEPTAPTPSDEEPAVGYWILNITSNEGGSVSPMGATNVSTSDHGITVTANPSGMNHFMYWLFDGQQSPINELSVFVPTQADNSTHSLKAFFAVATPVPAPIVNGAIGLGTGAYQVYSFSIPYDFTENSITINVEVAGGSSNTVRVQLMSSSDFAAWQSTLGSGTVITGLYNSGLVNSIQNAQVSVPTGGTYYVVLDNTADIIAEKTVNAAIFYFWT